MASVPPPSRIPKTIVIMDIKPLEAETDMSLLETSVRAVEKPGLVWGSSKLVDMTYGIQKLQITLVVEDKVDLTELEEEIGEMEDYVQSTDIVSMQKL